MTSRLLIIKRQCSKHATPSDEAATAPEILHGPWLLEPENSLGTPLTDADIAKDPTPTLKHGDDAEQNMAEHSVLEFLTRLLAEDRFKADEEWTAWMLIGLEFKRSGDPSREWIESFDAIIERESIDDAALL